MRFLTAIVMLIGLALPALAQESDDAAASVPNLTATLALIETGPDLTDEIAADAQWRLLPLEVDGEGALPADGAGAVYAVRAPAGLYRLSVRLGAVAIQQEVRLTDTATALQLVLDAGVVEVVPKTLSTDEAADPAIAVVMRGHAGAREHGTGQGRFVMPAGVVDISIQLDEAEARARVSLVAGTEVRQEIALDLATVTGQLRLIDGGDVLDTDATAMLSIRHEGGGQRGALATAYGDGAIRIGAGTYVLEARLGGVRATSPAFTLAPGESRKVDIVLDAGRLSVTAPGAYRVSVLGGPGSDQDGAEIASGPGPTFAELLSAGGYRLVLAYADGQERQQDFGIEAGAVTKLEIPAP